MPPKETGKLESLNNPSRRRKGLPPVIIHPGYTGPDPDAVALLRMMGSRDPVGVARSDEEKARRLKRLRDGDPPPTAPRKCLNPGWPQHPWTRRPQTHLKNTFPTYLTGPKQGL